MKLANRYRSLDLAVVGSTFFSDGGDWRSIYAFFRTAQQEGRNVQLIDLRRSDGLKQLLAAGMFSPRVIVNAMASLMSWPCLLLCLLRRDVYVYLHETEFALDAARKTHPVRFRLFRRIMRRNPVLCVSHQAEALYRQQYGSTSTHVVYECARTPDTRSFRSGRVHIVMAGSMDERKGVTLFSRVAELAADHFPDWQFHWIGGRASERKLEQSARVTWHGWQPGVAVFLAQADVFLLSSVDDPCPLAALEALALHKRCVAYRNTGIAELIEGIAGCAVYDSYAPEAALAAVERALHGAFDREAVQTRIMDKVQDAAYAGQLQTILGLRPNSPPSPFAGNGVS